MSNKITTISRRSIIALPGLAVASAAGLVTTNANAANIWALRHDGPVAANRGAWNDKFVCAENWGNDPLVADRNAIGSWEKFHWEVSGGSFVRFQAQVNGKWVKKQPNGKLQATESSKSTATALQVDTSGLSGGHFRLRRFIGGGVEERVYLNAQWELFLGDGTAGIFLQISV